MTALRQIAGWVLLSVVLCAPVAAQPDSTLAVGSKKFTENVILGWVGTHLLDNAGYAVTHEAQLGGSRFLWDALVRGDIDAYPEYTGTLLREILAGADVTPATVRDTLARYGIAMSRPLGFNNTYALGMRSAHADSLGIRTISDLQSHPNLTFGFSNEFMDRGDGWPSLKQAYALPQSARGVDHDLAYRGLQSEALDVVDLYSTDAEVQKYDLRVLRDDRDHFPEYNAVLLYRTDLPPTAVRSLTRLEGQLSDSTMQRLNGRAKIDQVPEAVVAATFVQNTFGLDVQAETLEWPDRVWERTKEHLVLVGWSLGMAIVLGIPFGLIGARVRVVGPAVLLLVGLIYTVPSLALLAVMVPPLGLGRVPAVAALFLYSLLPIVWNTYTGLHGIPRDLSESADALGLSTLTRLWRVELPLAARSILGGIKIAGVLNIGTATLGALIGAGGYGQPILTGIRRANLDLILEGTVPAAILTIAALLLFEGLEHVVLPRSMRAES